MNYKWGKAQKAFLHFVFFRPRGGLCRLCAGAAVPRNII